MRPAGAAALSVLGVLISVTAIAQERVWSLETAPFVFTSQASGNSDLWLQRGAHGAVEDLTVHEAQDHAASWFPDGVRIAF